MKKIEVTVVRRTYAAYEIEVDDDFEIGRPGSFAELERSYFNGDWGSEDELIYEETANWDIDSIVESA